MVVKGPPCVSNEIKLYFIHNMDSLIIPHCTFDSAETSSIQAVISEESHQRLELHYKDINCAVSYVMLAKLGPDFLS